MPKLKALITIDTEDGQSARHTAVFTVNDDSPLSAMAAFAYCAENMPHVPHMTNEPEEAASGPTL